MGKKLAYLKRVGRSMAGDVKREWGEVKVQYGKAKKQVSELPAKYKKFKRKTKPARRSTGKALDKLAGWGEAFSKNIEREYGGRKAEFPFSESKPRKRRKKRKRK